MTIVLIVVAVVVVIAVVAFVASRRRPADGVDTFRRQIDALSHEARRPVVDQVHHAQQTDPPAETADDAGAGDSGTNGSDTDDEDGADGT